MKRFALHLCVFFSICIMGLVAGSAAGFKWGTLDAGMACLMTFVAAIFCFVAVMVMTDD